MTRANLDPNPPMTLYGYSLFVSLFALALPLASHQAGEVITKPGNRLMRTERQTRSEASWTKKRRRLYPLRSQRESQMSDEFTMDGIIDKVSKNLDSDLASHIKQTDNVKRRYVSNIIGFLCPPSMIEPLSDKMLRSKLFNDDTVTHSGGILGSHYISVPKRLIVFLLAYIIFPFLQRIALPSLVGINVDDLSDSIIGEFSPIMDVLYALLVSDAIARLTSRQEKLQERAIIDSTHLSNIVRGMKAVFRQLQEPQHPTTRKKRVEWQKNDDETTKHQILEHGSKVLLYVWEYTDVLIFGNRLCELRDILYEDPLTKMEEAVEKLQKLGPPDSQAFRKYERMQESIETLRFTRLQRLDNEGEALPSGIKTMMDTLSVYILLSYIFLSSARELEPTLLQIFSISSGIVKASDLLSHVFSSIGNFFHLNAEATCFAVLASWLLVVRNLIRDLESPFDGAVHLRRMVITNSIFSIRRDVEFALRDMDLCSVWDQAQRSSQDSVKRLTSIEEVTQKKS